MKKTYETPSVEKIAFQYRDQVVVASGGHQCIIDWTNNAGETGCSGTVVQNSQGVN
ncbi:MAG: hypothetical protein IKK57_01105 [Clostridia bacterium]|nr:hypothetical protein [Clostridia bacterium]